MTKTKELNPEIVEKSEMNIKESDLKEIAKSLKDNTHTTRHSQKDDTETFFRGIIKDLSSKENLSTKTEYLSVRENYIGAKSTFFGRYCNVPFLENFINIFEEKRVSLERKGRKEILMALQYRQQELESQRQNQLSNMFGTN